MRDNKGPPSNAGRAPSKRERGPLYAGVVAGVLTLLYVSSFIDRNILNQLVKPIRADLAISDTEYSLLIGLAFVGIYTAIGIPLGRIADAGNRNVMAAIGCAVWSVMTAVCGLAGSFWGLFVARIGVGVGEAALSPAAYSLLADYFPPHKLARAMSVYSLGVPVGSGLALLIGGVGIEYATEAASGGGVLGGFRPWQVVMFAAGLPGIVLALLTILTVREPVRRHHVVIADAAQRPAFGFVLSYIWKNRAIYAAPILSVSFSGMISYGASAWMPAFLMRVYDFTPRESGLFLGLSTVFLGIPGTLAAGWIADKLVERGRADGHLVVAMVYCIGVLICGALGPIVPIRAVSLTLIALLGFFTFTWTGLAGALLQIVTPNRMRGQVSAIYLFSANMIGLGLGPFFVARSTDFIFHRDDAVGKSLALVGVIAIALTLWVLQSGRKALVASGLTGGGPRTIAAEQPRDETDAALEAPVA